MSDWSSTPASAIIYDAYTSIKEKNNKKNRNKIELSIEEVLLILPSNQNFGSKDLNLFGNLFGRRTFINFITNQATKEKSIDFKQGKIFLFIVA